MENDKPRFLPAAEEALRNAGWFPGRVVPEEQLREWYLLKDDEPFGDCPIFPAALRALREFGGLHIEPVTETGVTWAPIRIHFDPVEAMNEIGKEGLFVFGWVLETSLYPLANFGEDEDNCYHVAIDERGQIYGFFTGLEFVAASLDEAINQVLGGTGGGPAEEVDYSIEKSDEGQAVYEAILEGMQKN